MTVGELRNLLDDFQSTTRVTIANPSTGIVAPLTLCVVTDLGVVVATDGVKIQTVPAYIKITSVPIPRALSREEERTL